MSNLSLQEKARLGRTVALARLKSDRARQKSLAMFCTIRNTSDTQEQFLPTFDKPAYLAPTRLAA